MPSVRTKLPREEVLRRKREAARARYQRIKNDPHWRELQAEKYRQKCSNNVNKEQTKRGKSRDTEIVLTQNHHLAHKMIGDMRNSSRKAVDNLRNFYDTCIARMMETNPELTEKCLRDIGNLKSKGKGDSLNFSDVGVQVDCARESTVAAIGSTVPASKSTDTAPVPKKQKTGISTVSYLNPGISIKIEDDSSRDEAEDDMTPNELSLAESIAAKMFYKEPMPSPNSSFNESYLHCIILENLPPHFTSEELQDQLFSNLLSISSSDVLGITVHNSSHGSTAQVYLTNILHVQKIMSLSGKYVLNSRVMSARIGRC